MVFKLVSLWYHYYPQLIILFMVNKPTSEPHIYPYIGLIEPNNKPAN